MHFFHLKTSGFLRVLRTRDRILRSNTWFIHSLLERILGHDAGRARSIRLRRGYQTHFGSVPRAVGRRQR